MQKVSLRKLRLFLSRSYRISSQEVAPWLSSSTGESQEEQNKSSLPNYNTVIIIDGKCPGCGVSETD